MKFFVQLFKLAIQRKKSKENYFRFQEFQANRVVATAKAIFGLDSNISVIDFGCGNGGYTYVLAREFKEVIGVDLFINPVKEYFEKIDNVRFESADLITYRGNPVDFLFCASVIEHILKNLQSIFIQNLNENLKKGGYLYLSFPPFKSLIGGHICAPFHYLPDPIAFYLTKKLKKYPVNSYETIFGTWGLTKTSIEDVEKLLLKNGFKIIQIRSRYMPHWYSKMFSKNNFLNWNAEFYCRKVS